jgi:hypothetical protein
MDAIIFAIGSRAPSPRFGLPRKSAMGGASTNSVRRVWANPRKKTVIDAKLVGLG